MRSRRKGQKVIWWNIAWLVLFFACYSLGFQLLFQREFHRVGYPLLLVIPLLYATWHLGIVGGVAAGWIGLALNLILMRSVNAPVLNMLHAGGAVAFGLIAFFLGRLRQLNAELKVARDRAQEASEAKSMFLANMSHEIRTPMNAILGTVDLIQETPLDDTQRKYLRVLSGAGESLLQLINDILDLSRIEAGELTLERRSVNLVEFMESTVDILTPAARAKSLEFNCHVSADTPATLRGDPVRLRQILLNIVGNAIKFTPRGSVLVEVRNAGVNPDGRLRFSVSDTGIGLTPEQKERIFEDFTQADISTTRRYGGTGLGLSISKRLIEKMQGAIQVRDNHGGGSIFAFTVQLELERNQVETSEPGPVIPERFKGMRALVVDDQPINRMILREILSDWGLRVEDATDGFEGLSRLRDALAADRPYDLCLLDYGMPDRNGHQTYRKFLEFPGHYRTRVAIVTSYDLTSMDESYLSPDLPPVLMKPVRRPELLQLMIKLFQVRHDSMQSDTTTPAPQDSSLPALRILLVEDNPDNRLLIQAYLKNTAIQLESAENGLEALRAFERESYDLIFMDMQMPEMDGYTATGEIRKQEEIENRKRTPVIALTASAFQEDVDRSLAAGCDSHMAKPIKKAQLLETLREWSSRARR